MNQPDKLAEIMGSPLIGEICGWKNRTAAQYRVAPVWKHYLVSVVSNQALARLLSRKKTGMALLPVVSLPGVTRLVLSDKSETFSGQMNL